MILTLGLFASCSDENIVEPEDHLKVYTNIIKASSGFNHANTKINVDISSGTPKISWSAGDSFYLFDQGNPNNKNCYDIILGSEGVQSSFGTTEPLIPNPEYAVFPTWFTPTISNGSLTLKLPASYNLDDSKEHSSQNIPMLGTYDAKQKNVNFKHLTALLRIHFIGLPQGYSTIKIEADKPISGDFKINDIKAEELNGSIIEGTNKSTIVTVSYKDNTKPFYFPLPTGTYNLKVSACSKSNKSSEISLFNVNQKDFIRGRVYNIARDLQSFTDKVFNLRYKSIAETKVANIRNQINKKNPNSYTFDKFDYLEPTPSKTEWPALKHLDNLEILASAFADTLNTSGYEGNIDLLKDIQGLIRFWIAPNGTLSENGENVVTRKGGSWYNHFISQPQQLTLALVKVHHKIEAIRKSGKETSNEEVFKEQENLEKQAILYLRTLDSEFTEATKNDPGHQKGANASDHSFNLLYRACLEYKYDYSAADVLLNKASSLFQSVIQITTEEGIQQDGSYFQHGPQFYVQGYGSTMIKNATDFLWLFKGTRYMLPNDKITILNNFMLDTYYQTIRGQYALFNSLGRGLSRPDALKRTNAGPAEIMKDIIPSNGTDNYQNIIDRINTQGNTSGTYPSFHKHYFRGDYTLHVRPGYTFGLRMSSTKTCKLERDGSENLLGYFLSDGSTSINVTGEEYYNIFPVWDWAKIPGVTAPHLNPNVGTDHNYQEKSFPQNKYSANGLGISTFAGGVSDGKYGVSAYAYKDDKNNLVNVGAKVKVGANKSWFFFDNEIVCTGVVSNLGSQRTINTTINQCIRRGEVRVKTNNQESVFNPLVTYDNLQWIFHGNIGYVFPKLGTTVNNNIWVNLGNQSGYWKTINTKSAYSGYPQSNEKIFALGFDHTNNKSYAYIVVPGIKDCTTLNTYISADAPVVIVSNTADIQSVYHKTLQIWQTAFFAENQEVTNNGLTLKSANLCLVMIQEKGSAFEIFVADPTRNQSAIILTLASKGNTKKITVNLTSGETAGSTAKVSINKSDLGL